MMRAAAGVVEANPDACVRQRQVRGAGCEGHGDRGGGREGTSDDVTQQATRDVRRDKGDDEGSGGGSRSRAGCLWGMLRRETWRECKSGSVSKPLFIERICTVCTTLRSHLTTLPHPTPAAKKPVTSDAMEPNQVGMKTQMSFRLISTPGMILFKRCSTCQMKTEVSCMPG